MARMTFSNMAPDAVFQFSDGMRLRGRGKQCSMDVLRIEAPGPAHNNLIPVFFPFQDRARTDAKLPAHI
jgi:hypothetical protein